MKLSATRAASVALITVVLLACMRPTGALPAVQLWGGNWYGQLGDGTTINRPWPVQPGWPSGTTALAGGRVHTLALAGGRVYAAGNNDRGQLGDGAWLNRAVPGLVGGIMDAVAIAAGSYHCLALTSNGSVLCWGDNAVGQLGDGTTSNSPLPVQVRTATGNPLTGIVAIGAGAYHSLAVRFDGTVWTWGYNDRGQLGDGTTANRLYADQVPNIGAAVEVAGGYHSMARLSDGTVMAWGSNYDGVLGDGTYTDRLYPVPVLDAPGGRPFTDVAAIAAGTYHSVLQRMDGTVWTCGANSAGQLGDGTYAPRTTPVPAVGVVAAPPKGIAGGTYHTLAIAPDGSVWAWGSGYYGQLGDGSWDDSLVPIAATGLTGASVIGAGGHHSMVVSDDRAPTSLYVPDRTATVTETMILRGYLRRLSDGAWLPGRSVEFLIDGSPVGASLTNASGRGDLPWIVWGGVATRTITCEYGGEAAYQPSSGTGTATCQTWTTKMATFDRTARITDRTELKCRLLRSDNVPIYNRNISFYVDGSFVITRPTNVSGYASFAFYDVPDGAGAGVRPILSEWPGDGGYAAISKTANLTVLKAIPYIWVLNKTVPLGGIANLYAYFRRLYDYQRQVGKAVDFKIDGTWVQTVVTDASGVARHLYPTVEPVGAHTITCEFAGDAWVAPGSGSGTLTIY